jgi:hypothetical protein
MKTFSFITILAGLLATTSAAPSAEQVEILISVNGHAASNNHNGKVVHKSDISTMDICLKVCWPETPTCPDGWYSNNFVSD